MMEGFTRTRQRPPTREEWEGLIRDRVREEVYYREALALGLDKDDLIIRRRLRQKMEFVTDDVVAQAQPTDDELSAYLTGAPRQVSRRATVHVQPGVSQPGEARRQPRARRRATARAVEPGRRQGRCLGAGRFVPAGPQVRRAPGRARSRNCSAKSSRRSWANSHRANGRGRSSPATACIWCSSAERTEGRLPALADVRDAVQSRVGRRPATGSEREILPAHAQALHGDHRAPAGGGSREMSRR